jgi:hypothetical protein
MKHDMELLQSIRLILVAMAGLSKENPPRMTFDQSVFAKVVEQLAGDNTIASRFVVAETVKGKQCPELVTCMTVAIVEGLMTTMHGRDRMSYVITMRADDVARHAREPLYNDALWFVKEYERERSRK